MRPDRVDRETDDHYTGRQQTTATERVRLILDRSTSDAPTVGDADAGALTAEQR
jgi:hypothetical protein